MSEPITPKLVTFVETVGKYGDDPTAPVDVVFFGHSAIFNLEREHPCFDSWLALLKTSSADNSTIAFTHTSYTMRIRSVELAPKISGVVEEVVTSYRGGTGFTIHDYPVNIFLVPTDQPESQAWLSKVLHSHRDGKVKVAFTYDAFRNRVTALDFAKE